MAAIDKLYTKYYSDARNLVAWLSNKRPSMLENLYDWDFSEKEFNSIKEERYNTYFELNKRDYEHWGLNKGREHAVKELLGFYKSLANFDISAVHPEEEIDYLYEQHDKLSNKNYYISDLDIPTACFTSKQDIWLKWHCPLDFVRQYLKDNCGMKEHWYYKLFFKY